jgi:hypothetical protein
LLLGIEVEWNSVRGLSGTAAYSRIPDILKCEIV